MIRYKTSITIGFLCAILAAVPGIGRADTADAQANYALTDPANGTSGTVQVMAHAVISQNMVIEYVTPMNLGASGVPVKTKTLHLVTAGNTGEQPLDRRRSPPLAASVAVQGMPNQTFAVSINEASRKANSRNGFVVATFTHNAGQTPYIGPAGGTEFTIGATLRLAKNTANYGYSGALDVIVSHN